MSQRRSTPRVGPDRRVDRVAIGVLLLLGVGIPALLALASGSIGIPHNDDWAYRRAALDLYRTGQIGPHNFYSASVIGQTLLAQPFLWVSGGAAWSLSVYGLLWSAIAVVLAYGLARRLLGVGPSFLVGLGLLCIPGYLRTASTFMTDIPCLALALGCLLLAVMAAERDWDGRLLAASLVVGVAGVSIREAGVAAPMAVVVAMAFGDRRWRRVLVAGAGVAITVAVILLLTEIANGPGLAIPISPSVHGFNHLARAAVTLGALLLPVVAIPATRTRTALLTVAVGALVVLLSRATPSGMMGNLWLPSGMTGAGVLLGARPVIFGTKVWLATRWLGTIGAVALFVVVGEMALAWLRRLPVEPARLVENARRTIGSPIGVLAVFALGEAAGVAIYVVALNSLDRYLWELVPVITILVLAGVAAHPSGVRRVGYVATAAGLALLGGVSGLLALNSTAYDMARWHMGEEAVSRGYPASRIDAGWEWYGFHASGQARAGQAGYAWFESAWSPPFVCALVSNTPLATPGLRLVAENKVAYRLFWLAGRAEPLYLYDTGQAGCPSPAGS